MFTRCPNCDGKQELKVDQLRLDQAIVWCPICEVNFDALERLTDVDPDAHAALEVLELPSEPLPVAPLGLLKRDQSKPEAPVLTGRYGSGEIAEFDDTALPWEQVRQPSSQYWLLGVFLSGFLLLGQLLYFHGNHLSQNLALRHYCQFLHCPLPAYQNVAELSVVSHSFEAMPDSSHMFKVNIVNQADVVQAYPVIALSLQDFAGNLLAIRHFRPQDYLPNPDAATIAPDAAVEIQLHIAPNQQAVGGYTFDLTY